VFQFIGVVADHGVDKNGVDERKADDTAGHDEEDEKNVGEEGGHRSQPICHGFRDIIPPFNGENLKSGIQGSHRRLEVLGRNLLEQVKRQDADDENIDAKAEHDDNSSL